MPSTLKIITKKEKDVNENADILQVVPHEKQKTENICDLQFDQLRNIPNENELCNLSLGRPQDEPEVTGRVVVSAFPTRKLAISVPSFARAAHIFLSLSPLQDISRSIHRLFFCALSWTIDQKVLPNCKFFGRIREAGLTCGHFFRHAALSLIQRACLRSIKSAATLRYLVVC